jgi:hypothetical protein
MKPHTNNRTKPLCTSSHPNAREKASAPSGPFLPGGLPQGPAILEQMLVDPTALPALLLWV